MGPHVQRCLSLLLGACCLPCLFGQRSLACSFRLLLLVLLEHGAPPVPPDNVPAAHATSEVMSNDEAHSVSSMAQLGGATSTISDWRITSWNETRKLRTDQRIRDQLEYPQS